LKSRPSVLTQARSRLRHMVDCLADDVLMQTRIMQQSSVAKVRILIENLYKFHVFVGNKLIRDFSDKDCNVKSLNKLLKTVRHSGSMRRRTGSSRRRCVRSDASLVFTRYSTNI